ncbi:MAG: hypothetical protein WCT14_11260 [Treponemataceae bacterium]
MESLARPGSITHVYYLRSASQAAGVSLLDRSGVGGYVWPAANGWTPLVVRSWARDKALLSALGETEVLLCYTIVEERGWSFELLTRDKCFLRYARAWAPQEKIEHELLDDNLPLLLRLMTDHNPACAGKSDAELRVSLKSALFSAIAQPQRRFASLLGLAPSDGLFYDELPSDILERFPTVIRVAAKGRGKRRSE